MSFTVHELRALHRDLCKWVASTERHLAAAAEGEDGPQVPDGVGIDYSGPSLAHLSILVDAREVQMLLRLADEIPGIEGTDKVERMVKTLRYSFWHLYAETFGEPPTEVETTGAQLDVATTGQYPTPKELPG